MTANKKLNWKSNKKTRER